MAEFFSIVVTNEFVFDERFNVSLDGGLHAVKEVFVN